MLWPMLYVITFYECIYVKIGKWIYILWTFNEYAGLLLLGYVCVCLLNKLIIFVNKFFTTAKFKKKYLMIKLNDGLC